jgi:hypothetical protein
LTALDLIATHREISNVLDEVRFDMLGSLKPLVDALDVFHTVEGAADAIPHEVSAQIIGLSEGLLACTAAGQTLDASSLAYFDTVNEAFGCAIWASYPGYAAENQLPIY